MDYKDIVRMALDRNMNALNRALKGLTQEERRFQPGPESNHIDYIVWHFFRVEDGFITRAQKLDSLWERDEWYERLGLPQQGNGAHYTIEQVQALPRYDMTEFMKYALAVREETFKFLDGLTPGDLERPATQDPTRDEYTVAHMWSQLIDEVAQHTGEVSYVRGLQRGLEADLPPPVPSGSGPARQ